MELSIGEDHRVEQFGSRQRIVNLRLAAITPLLKDLCEVVHMLHMILAEAPAKMRIAQAFSDDDASQGDCAWCHQMVVEISSHQPYYFRRQFHRIGRAHV